MIVTCPTCCLLLHFLLWKRCYCKTTPRLQSKKKKKSILVNSCQYIWKSSCERKLKSKFQLQMKFPFLLPLKDSFPWFLFLWVFCVFLWVFAHTKKKAKASLFHSKEAFGHEMEKKKKKKSQESMYKLFRNLVNKHANFELGLSLLHYSAQIKRI